MKGKSPDSSQTSFLMSGLSEQLNPRHPIYQLSKVINWESLEADFTRLYSHRGRPAKPVRLMISLLLLKQLHDLSDDQNWGILKTNWHKSGTIWFFGK